MKSTTIDSLAATISISIIVVLYLLSLDLKGREDTEISKPIRMVEWVRFNKNSNEEMYAKVKGGWLLRFQYDIDSNAVAFYPDPDHRWDGKTLINIATHINNNNDSCFRAER